ncbi:tetratricopeptide (TPR) repeat protein [Saccharothrix ecbatanensis]|uniref:Tetratricopeptide (TPR) repeat protein n=2 Tax=Saccharothrix ecbatanensis TaxID=1105145 RepID=A0A7W9HVD5_9PSEU|nr:tetratricopeptide (TPR) repeat protein [Saccharothrix ecbatanensis]
MGRASLISEFYHEDRDAFGRVYIEVAARQADGTMVPPGEMLGQVLRGLGVPDTELDSSDAARLYAFHRVSAGKRFLLVIKDAVSVEQVTNLIPAAAPDAVLVVTTRTMVRDLLLHDFADIPLGKLPQAESRELLTDRLKSTAGKIAADTLRELADLCDGYPLLIKMLAAQLTGRARVVERFLADLRRSGAALIEMDRSQQMARFLDLAYENLEPGLPLVYRRLALLPGQSFGADAAAIALDVPPVEAERLLDQLVDMSLLVFDEDTDRYSFYRVVRADALRRAQEVDGPRECGSARARIVTWYLDQAVPMDAALSRRWRVGPVFERYARAGGPVVAREEATAWFDAEWPALVASVGMAHEDGLHEIAWQTCVALFKYLHLHGHYDAWLDTHRLGVLSAQTADATAGLMQVISQRGAAHLALGELRSARADFTASLESAVRAVHPLGEQSAHEWLGKVAAAERDIDTALDAYDKSEAVIARVADAIPADQQGRMRALLDLHRARALLVRSEWARAAALVADGPRFFERIGEAENQAKCRMVLGRAAHGSGDQSEAVRCFSLAATLFEGDNARRAQADALRWLGDALAAAGRRDEALQAYLSAKELFVSLGDARADAVQERIDALLNEDG